MTVACGISRSISSASKRDTKIIEAAGHQRHIGGDEQAVGVEDRQGVQQHIVRA